MKGHEVQRVITVVPAVLSAWSTYLVTAVSVPVEGLRTLIDYQTDYFSERSLVTERSLIATCSSTPVALWPLCIITNPDGKRTLATDGVRISEPIALVPIESKEWKLAQPSLINALKEMMDQESVQTVGIATSTIRNGSPSIFASKIIPDQTGSFTDWDIVCNVNLSLEKLWSSIRSSYRPLVKRASSVLDVEILSGPFDAEVGIQILRDLHFRASGRITRGESTWDRLLQAVRVGEALVAIASKDGIPIGAALIWHSNTEAEYAVGAYDRSLMAEGFPIGHLIQWRVIQYLQSIPGLDRYRLGTIHGDSQRTKKVMGIDQFKMGFRTNIEAKPVIQISL